MRKVIQSTVAQFTLRGSKLRQIQLPSMRSPLLHFAALSQFSSDEKYSREAIEKLKKQAQDFYEQQVSPKTETKSQQSIIDMEQIEQWQSDVLDSSIPVVLDCYADWCQPCQKLTPILEERALKGEGKWRLVKMNIDKFPQLASALKIKSIPSVFLISNKAAVDQFVGTPNEFTLNKFFETLNKVAGFVVEDETFTEQLALAEVLLDNQETLPQAVLVITKLLENELYKNKHGGQLTAMLALAAAKEGEIPTALKHLNDVRKIFSDQANKQEVEALVEKVAKTIEQVSLESSQDPEISKAKSKVSGAPNDLALRFELAELQVSKNLLEDAIENLLHIVKTSRNWEERKANKLLLEIFTKLGATHASTIDGRKRLQKLLF